ncbi:MAG: hypothetical protein JWQ06_1817 [Mucilaginibacter sp.]|nr:hypothetical protein [Mucilaginibacter sp.]
MNNPIEKEKKKREPFSFANLSIQQRLPLFICILLLSTILAFSWVSYIGVKNASIAIGTERLTAVTSQLSSIFQQSINSNAVSAQHIANQEDVEEYLQTGNRVAYAKAFDELQRSQQSDTLCQSIQLLNAQKQIVMNYGDNRLLKNINIDSIIPPPASNKKLINVGKIYLVRNAMYYPVVAPLKYGEKTIGYVLKWRALRASKKSVVELAQLLGNNGHLYFGNDDNKFWTDRLKPVPVPPVNIYQLQKVAEYSREDGDPLIATARAVPNSRWLILVEFPKSAFLETANLFLKWLIIIGIILVIAGSFGAWITSRNITRPLIKLTKAASAIAGGDYSSLVDIKRQDEVGELAQSFNIMAVQVHNAQNELEQKVHDRTKELETANKDLESFSYSVSHDLRTPLRAINGYAMMLKEDFDDKLGAEGDRIINTIMGNAKLMGRLIDDLLAFSRLGRKEITFQDMDMNHLVKTCIGELLENETKKYEINISALPTCKADGSMIKQVWMNLIGNAIKYSSKNEEPQIEIGYTTGNKMITYFVKDNGVGFDMQYVDKLFGVFQRLHGNNEFEGTGVGLALAKRIIDKHYGTIRAEAYPGKGATFYFSLPYKKSLLTKVADE